MKRTSNGTASSRLVLWAETAADLMTPNPISLDAGETFKEAVAFLADKGYSAAPVIDEAGLPVGVLSRSDILVHDRETVAYARLPSYYAEEEPVLPSGEPLGSGFQVEVIDQTLVRDLMTPVVFAVAPDTPAPHVVREMLKLKVHRLFVVDDGGVLVRGHESRRRVRRDDAVAARKRADRYHHQGRGFACAVRPAAGLGFAGGASRVPDAEPGAPLV